jgi:4-hydroxybenzoate polyprenyltransferase
MMLRTMHPAEATAELLPLVVDLDGTLLATDSLWELILSFLRKRPFHIFQLIGWVLAGKAQFKSRLVSATTLDPATLPYRVECLDWLRDQKRLGRRVILATGADRQLALAIAAHLGIFDSVLASDGARNATGLTKADMIDGLLDSTYEYAGNAMVDVEIWRRCGTAIVVAPESGVMAALRKHNIAVVRQFDAPRANLRVWIKALRVHQWMKNLLIFTPVLTSHRMFEWPVVWHAVIGFLAFSMVASSTYLLNDLLDLPADRTHPTKRNRPLAAGLIPIPAGIAAAATMLLLAAGLSSLLPVPAALMLLGYWCATLTYSAFVKKLLIADVVALALFYTARVLYGGLATGIEISVWTAAFSAFTFFALAATKRINDLAKTALSGDDSLAHRGYKSADRQSLVPQAAATANIAILVLILYLNSPQVSALYKRPEILWGMCPPLLYWFNRIIALANRGSLPDDPILFAMRDRATYVVLASMALVAIAATL